MPPTNGTQASAAAMFEGKSNVDAFTSVTGGGGGGTPVEAEADAGIGSG